MGEQGVPAFNVWLEQGGDNRVLQVNKRVIEVADRKRRTLAGWAPPRPAQTLAHRPLLAPPSQAPRG